MARREIDFGDFELDRASRKLVIAVGGAKAMRIGATLLSGAWATRGLEIKKRVGRGQSVSFTSARTIAAGGGPPKDFTEDDLAGIAELEVVGSGTTETGLVRIEGSVEYDAVSVAQVPFDAPNLGEGAQVQQGQPPEV